MSVKICSDEMLAFYSKFDYIDFKYDLDKTNSEYLKTYRKLAEKENNEHNSDITIKNYGKMLANIDLITMQNYQRDLLKYLMCSIIK